MSAPPGAAEFASVESQILWVERYLYDFDCLSLQATPGLAASLGQEFMKVAPHFFWMFRGLLLDAAAMGVARLLDPSKVNGRNLTMKVVIHACSWLNVPQKSASLRKLQELTAGNEAQAILAARNKILAHADYSAVINYPESAESLFPSYDDISKVTSKLFDLCDAVRPPGGELPTHPRNAKNWKGVEVLLQHLALGPVTTHC
ncbi:MAG: AbiU2 domain-containing protein [Acidiferrobacterales bacterium]